MSFGNKAKIIETRINRRIFPIHFGVNDHDSPLEFKLVFGALEEPLNRFNFEEVSLWLTGHQQYQWLTIEQRDLHHVRFRCLCTEITPIFNAWLPYAFEAKFVCDCPYAYSFPFADWAVTGVPKSPWIFYNKSSINDYFYPDLTINITEGGEYKIINQDDNNRETTFTNIPPGIQLFIDGKNGIITCSHDSYNPYQFFNMNFFRAVPGENHLMIYGEGDITISGMFLHNVAA